MPEQPVDKNQSSSQGPAAAVPPKVTCPHCGSVETELFSHFGSMLLSTQHYCRNCRTVFDRVRWDRP